MKKDLKTNTKIQKTMPATPKRVMARASFVHSSPRKLQLIAEAVRLMKPMDAINHLKLLPHGAARPLLLIFQQAMGNAKNNLAMSPADLVINSLQIQGGPRGAKKADVHAHGARFDRGVRRKKMAHINLVLTEKK